MMRKCARPATWLGSLGLLLLAGPTWAQSPEGSSTPRGPYSYPGPYLSYYGDDPSYVQNSGGSNPGAMPYVDDARGSGYQSFYGRPGANRNEALVRVQVPSPDARVWIQDMLSRQRGYERVFISPPLEPGGKYTYTLRASWMENGREVSREKKVSVSPGQPATVVFSGAAGQNREGQGFAPLGGQPVPLDASGRPAGSRINQRDEDTLAPGTRPSLDRGVPARGPGATGTGTTGAPGTAVPGTRGVEPGTPGPGGRGAAAPALGAPGAPATGIPSGVIPSAGATGVPGTPSGGGGTSAVGGTGPSAGGGTSAVGGTGASAGGGTSAIGGTGPSATGGTGRGTSGAGSTGAGSTGRGR